MNHISERFLALNTVAMRNAELTSGIEVYSDETGEVYGSSHAAAKEAIGLTVISSSLLDVYLHPLLQPQGWNDVYPARRFANGGRGHFAILERTLL